MFRLLPDLHYNDPVMVTHLARLMECFSRLIGLRKALAVPAIQKVSCCKTGQLCWYRSIHLKGMWSG